VTRTLAALARRALRNDLRRPQLLAPLIVFPSLMLALNVGGLSRTARLPGFPHVHGFLDFQLASAITMSLLFGGISAGTAVALEIESGFFDRLVAAPIPRVLIVLARLVATSVVALLQVLYFLTLGLIFGIHLAGGAAAAFIVIVVAVIAGTGFGAIGVMIALRARSASTIQEIFPLVFVALFVSSAFFPRNLLHAPARELAAYNPLSYIATGMRDPIVSTLHAGPVLDGFAAAAGVTVVASLLSVLALRGRLREA
jgi:ABC-2 type transport system permease protein